MALVELDHVTYTYPTGSAPALRDVSLQIEAGEFVAVVGANGAGKSSLCYALTGLIPHFFRGALAGQVSIVGADTQNESLGAMARKVGMVLQNPLSQLSGVRYTVFEEVAFGPENLGLPPLEIAGRVAQALAQVGLSGLEERSPYSLSGGQQQRLAVASILAMAPPVLVLDEPTGMLDPQGCAEVFAVARTLSRQGITVVMAEHRLEWVAEHATRVVALAEGRLLLDGPPAATLAAAAARQAGIGWTRYTEAAWAGRSRGLWPAARPLPVTLADAVDGFTAPDGS